MQHFLSPIDVFDNEVKRNDYKPMIHNDSATISLGLMNIACTLLIFIKQLHLFTYLQPETPSRNLTAFLHMFIIDMKFIEQ